MFAHSPRLPIGGFAALSPPLTIVRKGGGDKELLSCMTCVNYVSQARFAGPSLSNASPCADLPCGYDGGVFRSSCPTIPRARLCETGCASRFARARAAST